MKEDKYTIVMTIEGAIAGKVDRYKCGHSIGVLEALHHPEAIADVFNSLLAVMKKADPDLNVVHMRTAFLEIPDEPKSSRTY